MENLKFSYKTERSQHTGSEHPLESVQGILSPAHALWESAFTCLATFVLPQPTLPEQQLSCLPDPAAAFSAARPQACRDKDLSCLYH